MSSPEQRVVNNADQRQYELWLDDQRIGLADYSINDDVITIPHVETAPTHRGRGYAAALLDGVVADARQHNLQIRPVCPYAASYMRQRPDTHDLLAR